MTATMDSGAKGGQTQTRAPQNFSDRQISGEIAKTWAVTSAFTGCPPYVSQSDYDAENTLLSS